jgi:molybdopterin-guanine dinucleotide biosynthesis protein A
MVESRWAAVVLAGGAARRLGGAEKVLLPVGGTPMLLRVIAAVAGADPIVVVGPPPLRATLPAEGELVGDDPPGGGPVAATFAGLARVPDNTAYVALLAGDLPFLSPESIDLLRLTTAHSDVDGAVFVDRAGQRQLLCGVWHAAALRRRLAEVGDPFGKSMRHFASGLRVAEVTWPAVDAPPWYDCDTEADLRHAQEMV